jgi:subtilisin family serine protease
MRIITSVLLLLGSVLSAGAQQTVRYVVQLQHPPVLASRGSRTALSRIEREHSDFAAHATAAGFTVVRRLTVAANVVIVEGPVGYADTLRGMSGVKRAFRERTYQQHFDASIPLHQIDSAWAAIPGATYNPSVPTGWNIAGQGVKIGILDSGIDVTHPYFQAPNMTAPSGFPKWSTNVAGNQALTSGKIIVARSYGNWTAQDVDGHGTAVASVAAGVPIVANIGPNGMALSGVAPAAWLGNYDVDANHDGNYPDSAILPALDDCAADGMDVISMSWGSVDYGGSLDPENQLYQEIFATLRSNGVVIVASAGNGGPAGYTVSPPAIDPGVIAAGAQQSTRINTYSPTVSSSDGTNIAASAADNNTALLQPLTGTLVNITHWDTTALGCSNGSAWPQAGVASGKILLLQRGTCTFVEKVQNAQTAGAIGVIVYNQAFASDGSGGDYLVAMDLYGATSPSTLANFPSLFVGLTDGLTLVSKVAGGSYVVTESFGMGAGDTHLLADFSSRGPIADLTIKPDLVAAGQSIVTAWCTVITLDANNNACDPFGYQFIDGTSFSAPLTAGAVALVKSARPGLTGDDYRSLVINSASPMLDDSGNTWPVLSAGAGSLDVLRAVETTVTAYPVSLSFGAAGSSVATSQQLTLKNVGTAKTTYNLSFEGISTSPTSGSPVTLASGGTVYMPFPNLALGDYLGLSNQAPALWTRSVTLAAGTAATVTVQAPPVRATPGTYQGFIDVTPSGTSVPEARIPWWFAVTAGAPNAIALDADPLYITYDSYTGNTDGTIAVRFVDSATGVMLAAPGPVTVAFLSGSAVASSPYQASSLETCYNPCANVVFPNVWLIDVTTSPNALSGETSTFRITSGNLTRDFTAIVY